MASTGLTVGLAVGVPACVIISCVALLWWLNQRKQRKEDLVHDDIDIDLEDNGLFANIHEAVMQPQANQKKLFGEQDQLQPNQANPIYDDHRNEKEGSFAENQNKFIDSSHSSSSVTDQPSTPRQQPRNAGFNQHNKTPSSFDFYDTVIPILQPPASMNGSINQSRNHSRNPSTDMLSASHQPPAPLFTDKLTSIIPSKNSSSASITGSNNNNNSNNNINNPMISVNGPGESQNLINTSKSLDNLAKQLTQPAFFEKLPSRASVGGSRNSHLQNQSNYRNRTLGSSSLGSGSNNATEVSDIGKPNGFRQQSPFTDSDNDSTQEGVVNGTFFR